MKTTLGPDEDVVLDGHQLEEAAAVDAHAAADAVAELEHGVGADADVVADDVVLADAGALAGLQAGAEGAAGVDGGERPDDGAGADGERELALAGAPRRLADDAGRLQVAALAQRDVGIQGDAGRGRSSGASASRSCTRTSRLRRRPSRSRRCAATPARPRASRPRRPAHPSVIGGRRAHAVRRSAGPRASSGSAAVDLGRDDVAGAVAELELAEVLGSWKSTPWSKILTFSTFSVSSYTSIFLLPTTIVRRSLTGTSQLAWISATMPLGKLQVDEGHVGDLGHDAAAAGDLTALGGLAQPVVEDAEVVRGEVPDHAHVLLVQAQVHALGGDEVDVAELAALDELLDLAHRRAEDEGVADHQREAARLRPARPARSACAVSAVMGFSTKTCLPGLERGLGERVVRADGRGDEHGVHARRRRARARRSW